jgi:hypothetical protein
MARLLRCWRRSVAQFAGLNGDYVVCVPFQDATASYSIRVAHFAFPLPACRPEPCMRSERGRKAQANRLMCCGPKKTLSEGLFRTGLVLEIPRSCVSVAERYSHQLPLIVCPETDSELIVRGCAEAVRSRSFGNWDTQASQSTAHASAEYASRAPNLPVLAACRDRAVFFDHLVAE